MKALACIFMLGVLLAAPVAAQEIGTPEEATRPVVRFKALDIVIDSGETALAAYQFELTDPSGRAKIVGVEGGESPAFKQPPYYDPAALNHGRIIVAAFSAGKELPVGRTRVARLHMRIAGADEPEYKIELQAAAGADGKRIAAPIAIVQGDRK